MQEFEILSYIFDILLSKGLSAGVKSKLTQTMRKQGGKMKQNELTHKILFFISLAINDATMNAVSLQQLISEFASLHLLQNSVRGESDAEKICLLVYGYKCKYCIFVESTSVLDGGIGVY